MASTPQNTPLAPELRRLLSSVRWRIRLYTLLQGLALIVCWLAGMFWLALALDYLPVLLFASEMPLSARVGLLAIVGIGTSYLFYRFILLRTFARLADHSMAILLERQNDEFHDSLLTSVELHEHPDHAVDFNREMLQHAGEDAVAQSHRVQVAKVFRWQPLVGASVLAVLLGASVLVFALLPATRDAFATARDRIVLLSEDPWDRRAHLTVAHVKTLQIEFTKPASEGEASGLLIDNRPKVVSANRSFVDRKVRVARGSDITLIVNASLDGHEDPGGVRFYWESADERGTGQMSSGRKTDNAVRYTYEGDPLKGILDSITFGVRGLDYRTGGYEIEVVDTPVVTEVQVQYDRPEYLVDEANSVVQRVTSALVPGMQVPYGSRVKLIGHVNKPLSEVYVYDVEKKQTTRIEVDTAGDSAAAQQFEFDIPAFTNPVALEVLLVDTDGLILAEPHIIGLNVKEDDVPKVEVALKGVGSAVTPDAKFAIGGLVVDDNWLQRTWLDVAVRKGDTHALPLKVTPGTLDAATIAENDLGEDANLLQWIDLRDQRSLSEGAFELEPEQTIELTVKAADRYDLDDFDPRQNPHAGEGDTYTLEVVDADELLKRLERRELELRQRLELIIEELTQMRDSLDRVRQGEAGEINTAAREPGDESPAVAEPGDNEGRPERTAEQALALRRLWVKRASGQSEKSRGESEGVAVSLLDIAEEIENNRIDAEDRQVRLQEEVAAPLLAIVADDFPSLDEQLAALEELINQPDRDSQQVGESAVTAIEEVDRVLLGLDQVLQKMLDLETFNELVDLVRALIEDQEELTKETKKQRTSGFFD